MCRFLWRPEESIGCPGARVTSNCELPQCGCWELNSGPLEEQQALFKKDLLIFFFFFFFGSGSRWGPERFLYPRVIEGFCVMGPQSCETYEQKDFKYIKLNTCY